MISLGAGVAAFALTHEFVQRRDHDHTQALALELARSLRARLAAPLETLEILRSAIQLPDHALSHEQFQALSRSVRQRQPYILALQWFPFVPGDKRASFESYMQRLHPGYRVLEPGPDAGMIAARSRAQHLPLTYAEPLSEGVHGLDLAFDDERLAPARSAFAAHGVTLNHRHRLIGNYGDTRSLVACIPVENARWVRDPDQAGDTYSRGVLVALIHMNELMHWTLDELHHRNVDVELSDPDASSDLRLLYRKRGAKFHDAVTIPIPIADRNLELRVASQAPSLTWWSWSSGAGIFVLCLATMLWTEARRKARALERSLSRLGVYQLEGKIASGGMGTVFKAQHALLKRPTAIKIARDPDQAAYFAKEVLLTSRLTHPNTVLIYDYGQGQDGSFYCAMEYIEGYDLERLVQIHGPVPEGRALRLLHQIASSLKEAHERGLIHRDVKPSNIMITERGGLRDFVKVLDFGLVKQQPEQKRKDTFPSLGQFTFAGTPGYVAPEVIAGSPATAASDIFALGAVAYFLLSGQAPFAGASALDVLTKALKHKPAALSPGIHPDLDRLIQSCLERNPAHRPPSMQALSQELRRLISVCAAWSTEDAESWWADHPPRQQLEHLHTSLTFLLRHASTTSHDGSTKTVELPRISK